MRIKTGESLTIGIWVDDPATIRATVTIKGKTTVASEIKRSSPEWVSERELMAIVRACAHTLEILEEL